MADTADATTAPADEMTEAGELGSMGENTVTVEDSGPSRKKLGIEVPAESVDRQLNLSFETLASEAELPGFRRGRAPRRLLEKKFGSAIRTEARNQLMAQAYADAIERNGLKVIGEPAADDVDAGELEQGQPFTISVEVEVMPEFDLPETEGLKVRKPVVEIGDEQVSEELEKLRTNEGRLEELDEPAAGDYLTGKGVMTGPVQTDDGDESRTFHDIDGCVVRVPEADGDGSGMILGVLVEDLAKQLGTPKPGESVTITATGPEQHENDEIRGTALTITFDVQQASRIVPAEVAELVERYGMDDEAALRDAIKQQIEGRAQVQERAAMRQQVARHLIDSTAVEVPEKLSAEQAERVFQRRRLEMLYRGVSEDQIELRIAELRAEAADEARDELKMSFILHALAEKLDVRVEEAEVSTRIAQIAFQRRLRPEQVRQQLVQNRQLGEIVQQVRDHKVLDELIEKAEVEEMPAEEFNELMKKMSAGEGA